LPPVFRVVILLSYYPKASPKELMKWKRRGTTGGAGVGRLRFKFLIEVFQKKKKAR
jgi:hypothetical protein